MQEVAVVVRFTAACLGTVKSKVRHGQNVIFRFARDHSNRVMFLPSRWREAMRYAAILENKRQSLVDKIDWDPVIDGSVKTHKRTVKPANKGMKQRLRYALHEAFLVGDTAKFRVVLPTGLPLDNFQTMLDIVGTYKGCSPFRSDVETYGTFEVMSTIPTVRQTKKNECSD